MRPIFTDYNNCRVFCYLLNNVGIKMGYGKIYSNKSMNTFSQFNRDIIQVGDKVIFNVYSSDNILRFSTKKAAENYITNHKPVLSFNDVWNMSTNKDTKNNWVVIGKKQLQELIKSKL